MIYANIYANSQIAERAAIKCLKELREAGCEDAILYKNGVVFTVRTELDRFVFMYDGVYKLWNRGKTYVERINGKEYLMHSGYPVREFEDGDK